MAVPSGKRMTIREIADLAGVSIATVSRVLNGRDDVADETRDAVRRVIREHGYTANRNARGLSAGRTGLVGVLVPLVYPAYFSAILAGAAEALYEQEMRVVLSPTQHEHAREVSLLDRLMHGGTTDGALIVLPGESSEELERALDAGYPFVVVDPLLPLDERIPSVSAAHMSGADQAMRHLLSLGHRRIGAITGPPGWVATEDRRRGYRAALAAAGIPLRSGARGRGRLRDHGRRGGRTTPCSASATRRPPCSRSTTTSPSGRCGRRASAACASPRTCPSSASTTSSTRAIVTPSLTTVRQPLAEMGRTAVSLLVRLLEHQSVETLSIQLATRLVVRESTAPPRARALAATA